MPPDPPSFRGFFFGQFPCLIKGSNWGLSGGENWVVPYYGCSLSLEKAAQNFLCIALGQQSYLIQSLNVEDTNWPKYQEKLPTCLFLFVIFNIVYSIICLMKMLTCFPLQCFIIALQSFIVYFCALQLCCVESNGKTKILKITPHSIMLSTNMGNSLVVHMPTFLNMSRLCKTQTYLCVLVNKSWCLQKMMLIILLLLLL